MIGESKTLPRINTHHTINKGEAGHAPSSLRQAQKGSESAISSGGLERSDKKKRLTGFPAKALTRRTGESVCSLAARYCSYLS